MSEPVIKIKYFPLFIGVILALGVFLGMNLNSSDSTGGLFSSKFSDENKMMDIINLIEREYVDSLDKANLYETGIASILENLDPHSKYIPPIELKLIEEEMAGNFEGIGVQFRIIRDTVFVISPIKGGPSEKAGLLAGDRIIMANSSYITGDSITNETVIKTLKGEEGTTVEVLIKRIGTEELLKFKIERGRIPTFSIDVSYMPSDYLGYLKINRFTATTYGEFRKATGEMLDQGMTELIIDLRDNPGGYLKTATSIVDEFLEEGKLILFTEGNNRSKEYIKSTSKGILKDVAVVVLINENSASASEIVAGALQDNDRATIIGRRSYGKGLVSEQFPFPDGSGLRLTIARYYTPTGRCIQKPYDNGNTDYAHDFMDRYKHGELFNEDSIKLEDLPEYTTPNGRIVYGGGGIIPDIFVPIDTSTGNAYYNLLLRESVIFNFAFEYVDKHRIGLRSYKSADDFIKQFRVTNSILKDFISYANDNGIDYNKSDFVVSKDEISWRLKAFIARELFDFEGFYPIWHQHDNMFIKAMEYTGTKENN